MLELWKPILLLKDKNNPVVFDMFGQKFTENPINQSTLAKGIQFSIKLHHPIVIFYDDREDCYYYLSALGAWDDNKNGLKGKNPIAREVLVRESADGGLFTKDSYVDCSQIFKCDRRLLESLVDVDSDLYTKTSYLNNTDKTKILNELKKCLMEVPPYLSIVEVKQNNNGETYGESIFVSETKYNAFVNIIKTFRIELEDKQEMYIKSLISKVDGKTKISRERYFNGIDTCLILINKFFSKDERLFLVNNNLFNDSYLKYHILPYSPYGKAQPFVVNSLDEFENHLNSLDEYDLEKVVISKYSDEDLYNDCSELLEKLKEGIKAKDRGGDGGMSM